MKTESIAAATPRQDELYREAASSYGEALERLAYGYEADPDRRRDLVQEIHLALWQSFASFMPSSYRAIRVSSGNSSDSMASTMLSSFFSASSNG